MKIELTQKELLSIVRKHYNLASTIELEVTVEQTQPKVVSKPEVVATEQLKQDDVADLLTDVRPKKKKGKKAGRSKKRKYTPAGKGVITIPKNPKIDYTIYGEAIEHFLRSGEDFTLLPIDEGVKNSGMLYRYRTAAEMFGFRDQITLNAPRNRDVLIIALPGKAPQNYPHKKVDPHQEFNKCDTKESPKAFIKTY